MESSDKNRAKKEETTNDIDYIPYDWETDKVVEYKPINLVFDENFVPPEKKELEVEEHIRDIKVQIKHVSKIYESNEDETKEEDFRMTSQDLKLIREKYAAAKSFRKYVQMFPKSYVRVKFCFHGSFTDLVVMATFKVDETLSAFYTFLKTNVFMDDLQCEICKPPFNKALANTLDDTIKGCNIRSNTILNVNIKNTPVLRDKIKEEYEKLLKIVPKE